MRLLKSLITLSFLSFASFSNNFTSSDNISEVILIAHLESFVRAPADISVFYKDKLLGNISLYGSVLQKKISWLINNPFENEVEFQREKVYLKVINQSGHIIPVLYFEIFLL